MYHPGSCLEEHRKIKKHLPVYPVSQPTFEPATSSKQITRVATQAALVNGGGIGDVAAMAVAVLVVALMDVLVVALVAAAVLVALVVIVVAMLVLVVVPVLMLVFVDLLLYLHCNGTQCIRIRSTNMELTPT
jgi:hypothetical protein